MAVLHLSATGSLLEIIAPIHITSTQVEYDTVEFDFSSVWATYIKTAVFYSNRDTVKTQLLDENDSCIIPWDALSGDNTLRIGVYGIDGASILPTNFVQQAIHPGAYLAGVAPAEPSESVYQQVIAALAATIPAAETAAVSAAAPYAAAAAASALQLAQGVASPVGTYANLAALISADPDHAKIYVTDDNNYWNYHNGTAFVSGGPFQAAVLGDKSVDDFQLKFYAVHGQRGTNLFNKDTIAANKYINASGVLVNQADFGASDYIEVLPNTYYVGSWRLFDVIGFDVNKTLIGEITLPTSKIFITGATTKYIRISIASLASIIDSFVLNVGSVLAAYTPYGNVMRSNSVNTAAIVNGSVTNDKLAGGITNAKLAGSITADKLGFPLLVGTYSKNLFNKSTVTENKYAAINNGTLGPLTGMTASDFIAVTAETAYTLSIIESVGYWVVYYNSSQVYISGEDVRAAAGVFTTPADTAFIRVNTYAVNLDYQMVELGSEKTSYEPYAVLIARNHVKDLDAPYGFEILLPSDIYLVSGEMFSVYFANIIKHYQNFTRGDYYITCLKNASGTYSVLGQTYSYKWEYTPLSTDTTFDMEFRIISTYDDSVMASKVVTFHVADATAAANHGRTATIVSIGDSFMDSNGDEIIGKLYANITTKGGINDAAFIGLNDASWTYPALKDDSWAGYTYSWFYNSATGYLRSDRPLEDAVWDAGWGENEVSGWATGDTYADLSAEQITHGHTKNQFYNPGTSLFDFSYYMTTYQSSATVNAFICALGLNDIGWVTVAQAKAAIILLVAKIQHIITSVHTYDADIKVLLYTIPKQMEDNNTIGVYFTNFAHYQRVNHNIELFNDMLITEFDGDTNVVVLPSAANFDPNRGYETTTYSPDKFTPLYTETLSDDIHPNVVGSEYIADTLYQAIYNVVLA